jgi:hypothetical protein
MVNKTKFFSYWVSSSLPRITNLHFKSFLYHHPNTNYDLWLDSDVVTSITHPDLEWLKNHSRITIKFFSLNDAINSLVLEQNLKFKLPIDSILKKILRRLHKLILHKFINLGSIDTEVIGISYKHSSPIFQGFNDYVYRSDIARLLIPLMMYKDDKSLYVDLDICFTSNLLDLCGSQAFSYWWEQDRFINSAILYTPNNDIRLKLLEIGKKLQSFRPWTLYTFSNCKIISMLIYSSDIFDPLWCKSSKLYGNAPLFFRNTMHKDAILNEINVGNYRAIHWHNNWHTTPGQDSVYINLLNKYSNENM